MTGKNINFKGTYIVNANPLGKSKQYIAQSDYTLGMATRFATNANAIKDEFVYFNKFIYPHDKTAPCMLKFEFDTQRNDEAFEKMMTKIGQSFEKIR